MYINPDPAFARFNDLPVPMDPVAFATLREHGIDATRARHIAHLFVRDALVSYSDFASMSDEESSEHFENIQSSNWQSVRWKPPVLGGAVEAWRVELRTMEVMLTDFENAAFTVFAGLLCRAVLFFKLELYIPMSRVDENMRRAERRNALRREKFWFTNCGLRRLERVQAFAACCEGCEGCEGCEEGCGEYSLAEILDGNVGEQAGNER